MKNTDIIEETYFALISNKVRSGLTILGIVIGIGSVITMVSIGQGAQQSITSNIESLGSNLLIITPGAQRGPGNFVSSGRGSSQTLTVEDSEAILREINLIKNVAPELSSRYQVTAKSTNTNTQINGITDAYASVRNVAVSSGTFITSQHVKNSAKVAVIGPAARDDSFW